MIDKLAQDIYTAAVIKLAAISSAVEKSAASNLRSDLVLGRLSDSAKSTLMSTPRYSRANPGQILADIKSSLRGRGNDARALTQELKNRGIPYKVRGRGLSPKDIELDLSSGHDILNTPYLPSNYSKSFINNNVNRRFDKAVNNANRAGYKKVQVNTEYNNPSVENIASNYSYKKDNDININIPATRISGNNNQLQFDRNNAGSILHETNELSRMIQKDRHYDKIIKNDQNFRLQTAGEHPGVIQSPNTARINRQGKSGDPLNMFGTPGIFGGTVEVGPYDFTGGNNHTSATILMNELMDQHASSVGIKPKPGSLEDIFSFRKQGPNNPVNRMTGIDLTSSEQPFVPRNIAKNKKEYLKRIRNVRKAEDALQKEYLTNNLYNNDDAFSPLHDMLAAQSDASRPVDGIFKLLPKNTTRFNNINELEELIRKNPKIEEYLMDDNTGFNILSDLSTIKRMEAHARANMDESRLLRLNRRKDNVLHEMNTFLSDELHKQRFSDSNYSYFSDYIKDMLDDKRAKQYRDFLINYLRNKGIAI